MKDLRSPLAKAKNWGVSPDASYDFLAQRMTALALVPLVIWLCLNIAFLPQLSYPVLVSWLQSSLNSVMMILIVIVSFIHAQLGLQIIFEDYIAKQSLRITAIFITRLLSYFLMALGVYSIIKITLGGQ